MDFVRFREPIPGKTQCRDERSVKNLLSYLSLEGMTIIKDHTRNNFMTDIPYPLIQIENIVYSIRKKNSCYDCI